MHELLTVSVLSGRRIDDIWPRIQLIATDDTNMLHTTLLLMTVAYLAGVIRCSNFRGIYITWVVDTTDARYYPANSSVSTVKVHVRHGVSWRRSDGPALCTNSSIANCTLFSHSSWYTYYGFSEYSQPYTNGPLDSRYFCEKFSIQNDFNIGSKETVMLFYQKQYTYKFKSSGCCWLNYLAAYPSASYNAEAVMSFKVRPNYVPNYGKINTPPQIEYIPLIQHDYYGGQRNYRFPVSDPDGDTVKCRWAANSTEGGGMWAHRVGTLYENCSLTIVQGVGGWHGLAIIVEDHAYNNGYYKWHHLSSIPLQFSVNVYYSSASAVYGKGNTNCTNANAQPTTESLSAVTTSMAALTAPVTVYNQSPTTDILQTLNGCNYYKVLSEPDRAATYSDGSYHRCDQQLYGWYRFMGQAGNRMINYCPNTGGYTYRCGTQYQGWISYNSHPHPYSGAVSGTVCFSSYGSCSCSYSKSIKVRNCGTFTVYWLENVPICNARYCGIKDKSAVVSCSQNYMRIDLDRLYFNTSLYSNITLRNPACTATYTASHITLGSVPGVCGSVRRDTVNHIVYENDVIFTGNPTGIIQRNMNQKLTFSCLYSKTGQSSSVVTVGYQPISSINATEVGYGNFSFNFAMYTDRTFTRMHSFYPVSVKLRDWMYFEVQSSTSDANTVVLIDQCFSTPTMDRNHFLKYIFINNRCRTDKTVQFHNAVSNRQRFSIQAFQFLSNSTAVYIHCLIFLCLRSSSDYRCTSGCPGNNIYRGRRDVSGDEKALEIKYYLLEREVRLAQVKPSNDKQNTKTEGSKAGVIGASVGCFALMCVIIGLVIKMRMQNKRAQVGAGGPTRGEMYVDMTEKQTKNDCEKTANEKEENPTYLQNIGVMNKGMEQEVYKVSHA